MESYLCESQFAACAWRKCSTVYRSASTRVNEGVMPASIMPIGVASPARESDDMVAAKFRCSIYVFWQCYVVLRHGFNKGCIVFMHEHWIIFMQGVW